MNTVIANDAVDAVVHSSFNPFAMLTVTDTTNEVTALAGRFNKTWKSSRNERITEIVSEYHCSTADACFAVWLQDDARAILSRERIKSVADAILDILPESIGKDGAFALQRIETLYTEIPVIERSDVGRKVREAAMKTYTAKVASMMLELVYKHLGLREAEWMQ